MTGTRGSRVTLVERQREWERLTGLLTDCAQGSGRVALVSGGLTSGKTELLHHFAEHAVASGALALTATGSRAERTLQLGVIRQLFERAALPSEIGESPDGPTEDVNPTLADPSTAQTAHNVCTALLNLARDRPVVIGIDDVQFADVLSLQVLLYLQRRMRSARIFLIVNELAQPRPAHPLFRAEVLSQRRSAHLELAPLTRSGVAELLAGKIGPEIADRAVDLHHAISGGNPLLLHALIEDYQSVSGRTSPEAVVGQSFAQAVLDCLHRWEPSLLATARGLAVLDEPASPALLGRLLGIKSETAGHAVDMLTMNGLLDEGHFRHPAARTAVLDSLPRETRSAMHLRAAEQLHQDGATATTVAGHLVAADQATGAWVVGVLKHAAAQALSDGEPEFAVQCLELARRASECEHERADITTLLLGAESRLRPSKTARHIDTLRSAFANGHLAEDGVSVMINYLLWQGQPEEAARILSAASRPLSPRFVAELKLVQQLVRYGDPELAVHADGRTADLDSTAEGPVAQASAVLDAVFSRGTAARVTTGAEHVLRSYRLRDETVEALVAALFALIYADRGDRAAAWCDSLLDESAARGAVTWPTTLFGIRAHVSLIHGDLAVAVQQAREALSQMSAQGWGLAMGLPLAVLLRAMTSMGDYDAAAELLKHPVPEAMSQTIFGVGYLHARGHYSLATGNPHAALRDFEQCAEMLRDRGCDLPTLVPWRTDAARVHLRLGRPERARELVSEQLALPAGRGARTRGMALRVLASASDPGNRVRMLKEAVDLLHTCGDRLELAHALADCSRAYHVTGEFDRARVTSRRAMQMAKACQAKALYRELAPSRVLIRTDPTDDQPRADEGVATLSDAERRVAVLAARGHTNREIGRKLFITVSTVEQHLTRVYRKLNVQRRADLRVHAVTGTS